MKLKLSKLIWINPNKKCSICGYRLGHQFTCSKIKNCKHVFVSTYNSYSKIWTGQCVKCLTIYAWHESAKKETVKEIKSKGYKFI